MKKSPANAAALGVGSVIAGKYRLLAPVAEGGMGAVWRAEDLHLAAPVAVKVLRAIHAHNAELRARFEAEAAIGAQLRSPHVVQVFELGVDHATDLPFIAMELLEGESLQERLQRAGPLGPRELLRVVSQVAQALTRAHALGIVHRDLKPANIFLVRDGATQLAKVLDFGIAKRFADASGRLRTLTGDLLGTPTYMSPEQLLGARHVDHRTDLWSLGVIAVECLTGKLPFDADHLAGLALAICHGRSLLPSSLGPVPPGFDEWFQRATASSAEARFDSAAQLAEALRAVCGGEPSADEGTPYGAVRAAADTPQPMSPPLASMSPLRTVQLQRPQQQRRVRRQRALLLAALGSGVLLVWGALSVRLPESAPRSAAPAPRVVGTEPSSVVLSNEPRPGVAPAASDLASRPTPPLTPAAEVVGAAGATSQAPPVAPQPRPTTPRRSEAEASAPAPRPPPPADPDNLGF